MLILDFKDVLEMNDSRKLIKAKGIKKLAVRVLIDDIMPKYQKEVYFKKFNPRWLMGRCEFIYVIDLIEIHHEGKRYRILDKINKPNGVHESKYADIEDWRRAANIPENYFK